MDETRSRGLTFDTFDDSGGAIAPSNCYVYGKRAMKLFATALALSCLVVAVLSYFPLSKEWSIGIKIAAHAGVAISITAFLVKYGRCPQRNRDSVEQTINAEKQLSNDEVFNFIRDVNDRYSPAKDYFPTLYLHLNGDERIRIIELALSKSNNDAKMNKALRRLQFYEYLLLPENPYTVKDLKPLQNQWEAKGLLERITALDTLLLGISRKGYPASLHFIFTEFVPVDEINQSDLKNNKILQDFVSKGNDLGSPWASKINLKENED